MNYIIIAILIDLLIGDPFGLLHPVVFIGNSIKKIKNKIYKDSKFRGLIFLIIILTFNLGVMYLITKLIQINEYTNIIFTIYFLYSFIAAKSLIKESNKVLKHLRKNDLKEARKYLSYIVGRDTNNLSEEMIIKATVETVAENTSDGIVAPIFYMCLGLLVNQPLLFVVFYKVTNTLDSMVGYKNEEYKNFGYFSAKLDDLLNLIPSRITSLFMIISNLITFKYIRNSILVTIRDRKKHSSPNAAYPESSVAGILGVELGGGSYYFGKFVKKETIGNSLRNIESKDIKRTHNILIRTVVLILLILLLINYKEVII